MELYTVALSDQVAQAGAREGGVVSLALAQELQDFIGELIRAFAASFSVNEPQNPLPFEAILARIEGFSCIPVAGSDIRDALAVDFVGSQHFVLDLHLVTGVEEPLAKLEFLVFDPGGLRIESAGGFEEFLFLILLSLLSHSSPLAGARQDS
jgi:hypothetical protein